jgi:hypothetical protein
MRGRHSGTRFSPFRPAVERLEDRDVPAAFLSGTTLVITGNTITIQDTGGNTSATAVTVTADGFRQTFAGNQVAIISIVGNPGGDSVTYILGGNSEQNNEGLSALVDRGGRVVNVSLDASRRDQFLLLLQPNQIFVGANYVFNVSQAAPSRNRTAAGINAFVTGPGLTIDNTSSLAINLGGGSGNDQLTTNFNNVNVGPANSFGFMGEDPRGTPVGPGNSRLSIQENGNGGTDQVFASFGINSNGVGAISATVSGGDNKKDTIGLVANVNPGSPPPPAPVLFLSSGDVAFAGVKPFVFTSNIRTLVPVF